ncbi:hypothetical protein KXV27_008932 [Aspergillus fumigatus]|nr:hypothetical protein KXW45_007034 [Aspergillus fumigatus]KAH3057295.1 hypothetical protein KXV27_008932 [Aspergillus fumigatus]
MSALVTFLQIRPRPPAEAAGAEQLWSDASLKYLVAHHFDANLEGDPVEYQVGHMAEVAEKRPRTEQESQPGF